MTHEYDVSTRTNDTGSTYSETKRPSCVPAGIFPEAVPFSVVSVPDAIGSPPEQAGRLAGGSVKALVGGKGAEMEMKLVGQGL